MADTTTAVGAGSDTSADIKTQGGPCYGGAAPATLKPYWYIVQPEDLSSFWRIPEKFSLPAQKGTGWRWHELRDANLDWPGGLAKDAYGSCVLQGLTSGAKLNVPGDWPDAKPGVKTEPKKGTPGTPEAKRSAMWGLGMVFLGVLGVTGLAIAVARGKKRTA